MIQKNSSQSISTLLQAPLTPDEQLWAMQLPDKFLEILSLEELKTMVRLKPEVWPEELRKKAEPYMAMGDEDEEGEAL